MAVTITADLTTINEADVATDFVTDNGEAVLLNTALQREDTGCIGFQVSEETGNIYNNNITAFDARNTRVYVWLRAGIGIDSKALGGFRIVLGDGTNTISYFTGGSDEPGFTFGPWVCQMVDTANLPTAFSVIAGVEANLDLANITEVGGGFTTSAKAVGNIDNAFIDVMRYGKGLVVTGGTSGDPGLFDEIIADDESQSNAWGIVRKLETGIVGIQGDLTWGATGSAATNSFFKDEDTIVVIENHIHASGSSITPFELFVKGGTGTTHFELGIPIGTGDDQKGRNPVNFQNSNPLNPAKFIADNIHVEDLLIYGSIFQNIFDEDELESIRFNQHPGNGSSHEISGVTFDRCGQVDLGLVTTRNAIFLNTEQTTGSLVFGASSLLWSNIIDVESSEFIANAQINGQTGSHGIEHPDAGTFTYVGLTFSENDFDIEFSGPTGTALVVNATADSDPGTSEITRGGASVTINNAKTLTLTTLQSGSEVRVYNDVAGEAGTEIAGIESSGTSFPIVYNFEGMDIPVIIVILHIDFEYIRLFLDLGADDATLPINQVTDRVYDNP